MSWRGMTTPADRFFACLPYLLPLFEAFPFGMPLLTSFPVLQPLFIPLQIVAIPYVAILSLIPGGLGGLLFFLALYFLVVRNENIRHFIRYNTMQSILFGIVLSIASLLLGVVSLGSLITETLATVLFLGTVAAVLYSVVKTMMGQYAEIPTITEAVRAQVP